MKTKSRKVKKLTRARGKKVVKRKVTRRNRNFDKWEVVPVSGEVLRRALTQIIDADQGTNGYLDTSTANVTSAPPTLIGSLDLMSVNADRLFELEQQLGNALRFLSGQEPELVPSPSPSMSNEPSSLNTKFDYVGARIHTTITNLFSILRQIDAAVFGKSAEVASVKGH